MARGELGEAALRAVVGGATNGRTQTHQQFQSTLESIIPKINKIDRLNQQLDDSQKGDKIKLKVALENAQRLVKKCGDVAC